MGLRGYAKDDVGCYVCELRSRGFYVVDGIVLSQSVLLLYREPSVSVLCV